MTDAELAELAFSAHVDYCRRLSRSVGAPVLDEVGLSCFASPHPMPFLVNGAVRTDRSADPADILARAGAFFEQHDRGYQLLALAGPDDDLIDVAATLGHAVDGGGEPVQALTSGPVRGQSADGVAFRPVTDAAAVADYTAVCVDAHAVYDFPPDFFPTIFAEPAAVLGPDLHPVVGYDGDRPVAAATAFLTRGVAYIGWVAVVGDQHRRGLGAAVTAVATNRGLELGAQAAVLMASPMGAPVYRRMGFSDVGTIVGISPPVDAPGES